jgi:probable phosphoglycerate mutase
MPPAATLARVPTRILVLRHGQSTWNAARRWQGQADPPLTELGEEQAYQAARKLGSFDLVVASDLERARRTAEIIAGQLGIGPIELDERLRENHAGEWEGLTKDEVEAGWPGYLEHHRRPPGFEMAQEVEVRALAALIEAGRAIPDGEVLAVSHGGVIRVLRRLLADTDTVIPNLGGSWFAVHHEPVLRVDAGEVVSLIEDLDGPGPAQAAEAERL